MVLEDVFSKSKHGSRRRSKPGYESGDDNGGLDARLASPIDRLAANVAELALLLPLIGLVTSPVRLRRSEALVLGDEAAAQYALVSEIGLIALTLILYHTVFVALYGGTPGKLALRLRVVSLWENKKPRPIEAFLRALVWTIELACLGIPFCAVFSNYKRRPFHDRIADTAVIAIPRSRQAGLSSLAEMSIASGFQSAVLAMLTLLASTYYADMQIHHESTPETASSAKADSRMCAEVREAIQEAPNGAAKNSERLPAALALFAASAISPECLDAEADFALWRDGDKATAYLAKAFAIRVRDDERIEEYLDKVCSTGSPSEPPCKAARLAKAARAVTEPDPIDAKVSDASKDAESDSIVSSLDANAPAYLKLAAIRRALTEGRFELALRWIDSFKGPRKAGAYVVKARVQALWALGNRVDARVIARTGTDLADASAKVELATWLCRAESEQDACGPFAQRACGDVASIVDRSESWLARSEVVSAYIKSQSCATDQDPSTKWRDLKKRIPSERGQQFLEALALLSEGKSAQGASLLERIASGEPDAYALDAGLSLAGLAETAANLAKARAIWLKLGIEESIWRPLGHGLLAKALKLSAWDEALTIGLKLSRQGSGDRALFEALVIASYRAGKRSLSLGMLDHALRLAPERKAAEVSRRSPASSAEFDSVARALGRSR